MNYFLNQKTMIVYLANFNKFLHDYNIFIMLFITISLTSIFAVIYLLQRKNRKVLEERYYLSIKYFKLAEITKELIFEYNYETDILSVSETYSKTFNIPLKIEKYLKRLQAGEFPFSENMDEIFQLITNPKEYNNLDIIVTSLLLPTWFNVQTVLIRKDNGEKLSLIGKMVDIDSTKRQFEQLTKKIRYDALTSLLNRSSFEADVENLVTTNKSNVLMILDLDNLKEINDRFGHARGDELIVNTALILTQLTHKDFITARFGGDEFMIYANDVTKEEMCKLANEINQKMCNIICKDKKVVESSVSIGICYSSNPSTLKNMFDTADRALYKVKNTTKNGFYIIEM